MHNKPHTEEAKRKIKEKQAIWYKSAAYQEFLARRKESGKKNRNLFKKGHTLHQLHPELREKIRPYQNGKNHWHWEGGKSSEAARLRGTSKYKIWRKTIFERDNFTCQLCNKKGVYLEADHYPISFAQLREEKNWKVMWDINNGRTLCRPCHDTTKQHFKKYYKWNST